MTSMPRNRRPVKPARSMAPWNASAILAEQQARIARELAGAVADDHLPAWAETQDAAEIGRTYAEQRGW